MKLKLLPLFATLAVLACAQCTKPGPEQEVKEPEEEVNPEPGDRSLVSIAIDTMPEKLEYSAGESFDATGLVVKALYSDMTLETITRYTIVPMGALTVEDTEITIGYKGKTATIPIKVNEVEYVPPVIVNFNSVPFEANAPFLWAEKNQKAKLKISSGSTAISDVTLVSSDDSRTVSFNIDIKDETTDEVAFKVLCPSSAAVGFNATEKAWNVKIPATQTPSADSVDPQALILGAWTESYPKGEVPDPVVLDFKHVTAYGRVTLSNMPASSGAVSSIIMTFSEKVTGNFFFDDGAYKPNGASNTLTVNTSSVNGVLFACAPAQVSATELEVKAFTENGILSVKTTLGENSDLVAGGITPFIIDFSAAEKVNDTEFRLVKSVSELVDNCEIIIASSEYGKAVSSKQDATNRSGVDVEITGGKILNPNASIIQIFTIGNDGSGKYTLSTNGTNYIGVSKDGKGDYYFRGIGNAENAPHDITIDSQTGDATISREGYSIRYNPSKDKFNVFQSGQQPVQIYKKK